MEAIEWWVAQLERAEELTAACDPGSNAYRYFIGTVDYYQRKLYTCKIPESIICS